MKLWILILVALALFATNGFSTWCFQDNANESSACGGLNTGFYYTTSKNWNSSGLMHDSDLNTYAELLDASARDTMSNWTKPANVIGAIFQLKFYNNNTNATNNVTINVTLPTNCWNKTNVSMDVGTNTATNYFILCSPDGGASYSRIYNATYTSTAKVYEDGMWWQINTNMTTVNVTSPTNTTYTANPVYINFSASSDNGINNCWYTYDIGDANYSIAACANGTSISFADRSHNITVFANDTLGNINGSTVYFTMDIASPIVAILSPTNSSYNTTSITLNFTASDANLNTCWYSLNGAANTTLSNCANTTITGAQGANNITVYANDSANHVSSDIEYFYVDSFAPNLTVIKPTNTTYNSTTVNISYTVKDISAITCGYNLNGAGNISLPGCSNTTSTGVEGANNLIVYATDTLNNSNSSTVYFTIDTISPAVTILSPTNSSYNTTSITLNFTASDVNLDDCWYSLNGGANQILGACANTTITGVQGGNNITVYANDTMNHTSSDIEYFYVDSFAPNLTVIKPTNTTYGSGTVNISFTVKDISAISCSYNLNGVGNQSLPFCGNITASGNQGANSLIVYAVDAFNNLNSSTVYFTIDTITPVVTILYPVNNSYNATSLTLNYTVAETNKDKCWYVLNGGAPTTIGACANTTITAVEGANNITVYANDTLNHTSSDIEYFTVDTITPTITIIKPTNTTYGTSSINLSYTVADTNLNLCLYSLNGNANQTLAGCGNTTVTAKSGANNITVYVKDVVNHTNSSTVYFSMNFSNASASLIVNSPTNTTYYTPYVPISAYINSSDTLYNGTITFAVNGTTYPYADNVSVYLGYGDNYIYVYATMTNGTVYEQDFHIFNFANIPANATKHINQSRGFDFLSILSSYNNDSQTYGYPKPVSIVFLFGLLAITFLRINEDLPEKMIVSGLLTGVVSMFLALAGFGVDWVSYFCLIVIVLGAALKIFL